MVQWLRTWALGSEGFSFDSGLLLTMTLNKLLNGSKPVFSKMEIMIEYPSEGCREKINNKRFVLGTKSRLRKG